MILEMYDDNVFDTIQLNISKHLMLSIYSNYRDICAYFAWISYFTFTIFWHSSNYKLQPEKNGKCHVAHSRKYESQKIIRYNDSSVKNSEITRVKQYKVIGTETSDIHAK